MNLSLVNDEGIGTRPTSVERAGDGIDPLTEAKMAGAEAGVERKPFRRSIERRGALSIGDLMETMGQSSPRQEGRSHDRKRKRTKSTARRGSAGRYQDRDRR